ncbi:hypothetical protein [Pseudaminobacter soli (ex Li et al. 2025)]|nr:hypothetical protein [Mesorhizobium soli]
MKKTLVSLAALIALSGTAFAGDFANTLQYPASPRVEGAAALDYSGTASIKAGNHEQRQSTQATSARQGDSAAPVMLPMGNAR